MAGGQDIAFSRMRSFEAIEILDGGTGNVRITITMDNGDAITDVVENTGIERSQLVGSTQFSPFSLGFYKVKRVDFIDEGPCP